MPVNIQATECLSCFSKDWAARKDVFSWPLLISSGRFYDLIAENLAAGDELDSFTGREQER